MYFTDQIYFSKLNVLRFPNFEKEMHDWQELKYFLKLIRFSIVLKKSILRKLFKILKSINNKFGKEL